METVLFVIAGVLVVLIVVLPIAKGARRRARDRRVDELYEAAADRERLRERVADGLPIDLQNRDGNTALHLAYYEGRQEAVDALIAFGADENLRNKEGLSPAEMGEVAAVEDLLSTCIWHMDEHGQWVDRDRGRVIYDQLRHRKPKMYNPALVRRFLAGREQRRYMFLAIKLGVRGSERKLAQVLNGYGTRDMATDFLNSGSRVLREAAEQWAKRHGYTIHHYGGHRAVSWGRF